MDGSRLDFRLEAEASDSRARAATFRTQHGEVRTPLFMPVGTTATVKAQLPQTLESAGSQILLANTYHLLLRPGAEVFRQLGGIHRFMGWERSVLTDSGGYQIFSLPHSRSMTEAGAIFQSYVDGRTILFSPELSIETQRAIGSDIMMALDQCVASTADEKTARTAMEITHRWAIRSLAARGDSPQALFGIVQGALSRELRAASAAQLTELSFDGYAIGGLAVGETKREREEICEWTAQLLPRGLPRYLMGVGTPLDILEAVHRGIDMFDCIIPTQVAQRGGAFTSRGYLQMRRGVYKFADAPLDSECSCPTCARFSRAYLHHLTKTSETLGWQLLGQHNFYFYHRLMREIRASILADRFGAFYSEKREILHAPDVDNPVKIARPKRPPVTRLGDYAVHIAREGFASILHVASGEIMHMRTPPMDEARQLYVEQSRLVERLRTSQDSAPLVIWDVGLGAAANAMAALQAFEQAAREGDVRPLRIISFENDLHSLKLALLRHDLFPYLRHAAPVSIARDGRWRSKQHPELTWELVAGDFCRTMNAAPAPPDLIFYDMFSSKTSADAWMAQTFRSLFAVCGSRPCELFTYSCSTATRAGLLAAGFYVVRGRSMGPKEETTIALTPAAVAQMEPGFSFLPRDWLGRWERSHVKIPADVAPEHRSAFERAIREHPQFRSGTADANSPVEHPAAAAASES